MVSQTHSGNCCIRKSRKASMLILIKLKPTLWAIKVLFVTEPPLSCCLTGAEGSCTIEHHLSSQSCNKTHWDCEFVPYCAKTERKLQLSKIQLSALFLNNCLDLTISSGCSQPHSCFLPWQKDKIPAATVLAGAAEYPVKQAENHERYLTWNQACTNSW